MIDRRWIRLIGKARPDAQRRLGKAGALAFVLVALVVLVTLDRAGVLATPRDDTRRYDGISAPVLRVIDGDTLVVDLYDARADAASTRVRLWGIDTPEMARNGSDAEPFALDATRFVEERVTGVIVTLIVEEHRPRDRYGRLLAHVVLDTGEPLAMELLRAGLARNDARWPHRWLEAFAAAERTAKRAGLGLWAD